MSGPLLASLVKNPVTLSGATNTASRAGSDCNADFKFDNNGMVYERDNSDSFVQISAATDWIRPVAIAPDDYEIRYTGATGDTGDLTATVAMDTWHPLLTDFIIFITDSTPTPGGKSATFTIEIRKGSGPVIASASYTLTADREDA